MTNDITPEKQQLFLVMLDLLSEFSRVCSENGIKWYAFGGTMLGAVRHQGFIPWDDDVDVVLPREDYEKLKTVASKGAFKSPYFFQNPSTDKGYPKCFCRLRNSNTTELPYMDFSMKCNRGIFIDIFPLDAVPNNKKKETRQKKHLKRIRLVLNSYSRYYSGFGTKGTTKVKAVAYYLSIVLFKMRLLTPDKLYRRFEKIASHYSENETDKVGSIVLLFDHDRFVYDKDLWEGKTIWFDFENISVPLPERYDDILKHSYGDYMVPVQEPTNHGDVLFSTTVPYDQYIRENYASIEEKWFELTEVGRKQSKDDIMGGS